MHRLAHAPADWGEPTRAALAQKSPKALKLASAAIRQARSLPSLEAALEVEFRLALHSPRPGQRCLRLRELGLQLGDLPHRGCERGRVPIDARACGRDPFGPCPSGRGRLGSIPGPGLPDTSARATAARPHPRG